MRRLKPEETLDWPDLKRRLWENFPHFSAMLAAYRLWSSDRASMQEFYRRADLNASAKMTKLNVMATQKAIMKLKRR